ncbi:FAD-dependent monooxygenase [Streptomyces sp. NBS 14/10]|uniref:FAD-dependent monooxygenase n=1 Tax=Streptomyces sp. NBS 14/10 TaxID=1945643 RepID=UPI000B7FE82A|nr:FAD-dependent monooxygenase [Streptomyces sp. NBS 14/10]KAK1181359.1 FAD-dependent monooxygenase [Streptomyces sp. NBS 14/10]
MELNNVKEAVLIVGAGPSGLTLAIDLARRGVRARVVERGADLFPGSRGKGLNPRTQEVFDDLGVIDAVRRAGGPYPLMLGWEDGTRLGTHDMIERGRPTPGAPYADMWMVPQWRTARLLYARLQELGGSVEFGTELTGLTQNADGVEARLSRADGSAATVRAAYLVAADGGRSTVRRALGIPMTGETVDPSPMLVADVRLDDDRLDRGHWHAWPKAKGGTVALCPLAGTDHFQLFARYEDADVDATPDTSAEAVRQLIAERTHLAASDVREVSWASDFRARAAMAERFAEGRVFLVGDAAHIHSPAGGQGLNTSVQDAYNLGWKLGQVLRHGADPALLDTYEEERLPVAARVLGISTRIHRAHRAGDEEGERRGPEVRQLGLNYRGGRLAVDRRPAPEGVAGEGVAGEGVAAEGAVREGAVRGSAAPEGSAGGYGSPRAGDRAPDAPCARPDGEPFRLFDAFRGPHFTLLALGDTELPPVRANFVHTYRIGGPAGRPGHLLDPDGHIRAGYGERGLFLVRPDGYIGFAADGEAGLRDYLAGLGG